MSKRLDGTEADSDQVANWTAIRCGLAGVYVMAAVCSVKFIAALPRIFIDDWTWTELALFPFQVIFLGFFPGLITGILLPLRRYGHFGHAIMGAGCANVYLLTCFALFEFDGLLHARLVTVLAFAAIASFGGGAMGIVIAHDIHEESGQSSTSELMSDQHGNPDGMKWLAQYSRMPLERVKYFADADTKLIQEINYGVLFIMAFWSGPSVKAFGEITEILNRLDPNATLEFVAVDTDGAQPFYAHPEFAGKMGGWGEIAWIKNGVIQCTSGLGYNPQCFEPNTKSLLESR